MRRRDLKKTKIRISRSWLPASPLIRLASSKASSRKPTPSYCDGACLCRAQTSETAQSSAAREREQFDQCFTKVVGTYTRPRSNPMFTTLHIVYSSRAATLRCVASSSSAPCSERCARPLSPRASRASRRARSSFSDAASSRCRSPAACSAWEAPRCACTRVHVTCACHVCAHARVPTRACHVCVCMHTNMILRAAGGAGGRGAAAVI